MCPKDKTVVEALADAGVEVQTSCEQGVCGTCLTRVLEGEPDHRDLYLTPEEQAANDQFLPCCSRAKSARLVLDLLMDGCAHRGQYRHAGMEYLIVSPALTQRWRERPQFSARKELFHWRRQPCPTHCDAIC